jgi:ParB family transcriptional regulator, chromosome partitioning protein
VRMAERDAELRRRLRYSLSLWRRQVKDRASKRAVEEAGGPHVERLSAFYEGFIAATDICIRSVQEGSERPEGPHVTLPPEEAGCGHCRPGPSRPAEPLPVARGMEGGRMSDSASGAVSAPAEVKFQLLALEKIVPSKTNPRKAFDAADQEKLEASIAEVGIQSPIKVRPQNGHFEIIFGERRFRAAKKVGLKKIPAFIQKLSDDQALEIQMIENVQRVDLSAIEKAQGYQALIDRKIYDVAGLAKKLGLSTSSIYMTLKLLDLVEPAKKALQEGQIKAAHAEKLARLQPDVQKKFLERIIQPVDVAQGDPEDWGHKERREKAVVPVRALEALIEDEIHTDLAKMPWDKEDLELLPKAGACSQCPKRSGNCRDLYPELKKDSICTDRACFIAKFNAWIDRRIRELKAQGKKVAVISEEEYSWRLDAVKGREGVKRLGQWHVPGKKKCRNLGIGILFEGKRRGQEIDACTAEACGVHNPRPTAHYSSSSSSSPGKSAAQLAREEAKREEAQRKECRKKERVLAVYYAAIKSGPPKLGLEEIREIAFDAYQGDFPEDALKVVGLKDVCWPTAKKKLNSMKEADLLKIIRAKKLTGNYCDEPDPAAVQAASKAWKVDEKKIDRELKAKWAQEDGQRKIAEAALAPKAR